MPDQKYLVMLADGTTSGPHSLAVIADLAGRGDLSPEATLEVDGRVLSLAELVAGAGAPAGEQAKPRRASPSWRARLGATTGATPKALQNDKDKDKSGS